LGIGGWGRDANEVESMGPCCAFDGGTPSPLPSLPPPTPRPPPPIRPPRALHPPAAPEALVAAATAVVRDPNLLLSDGFQLHSSVPNPKLQRF
jgi:hypothetical protein